MTSFNKTVKSNEEKDDKYVSFVKDYWQHLKYFYNYESEIS